MLEFVEPDRVRLPLSDGEWIEVKRRLNMGETNEMHTRLYKQAPDGQMKTDPAHALFALVLAYLIDWSAVDRERRPIVYREKSVEEKQRLLESLSAEAFFEIRMAIEAHEAAMVEARAQEKKRRTGESGAASISSSPSAAAGVLSGSAA